MLDAWQSGVKDALGLRWLTVFGLMNSREASSILASALVRGRVFLKFG